MDANRQRKIILAGGATASLSRKDRLIAARAISIPTSIVRHFFHIDGLRKAMLLAFNLFISVVPLAIFAFAFASRIRPSISLSTVFVEQFRLHGSTALVVRNAFPRTNNIIQMASFIVVASFAISGFDVASALQKTFAEAWRVPPLHGWRGPVRGAMWFVVVFATFGIGQLMQRFPIEFGWWAYFLTVPLMLLINYLFWLATPRLLLDKELDRSDLRPGAILGTIASTLVWALSLIILPGWFSWYGQGFGGIGIALALLSWTYVISLSWVIIVVISAVMWERSATIDEALELAPNDAQWPPPPLRRSSEKKVERDSY